MKVAIPLTKNVLAPLGITAAASAIDVGIKKKIHGSGTITLISSNEEMNDIMKIVQALEDSNILLKGVTKTIENESKEQKGGFLSMSLGTLGASLLGNLLTGKGIVRAGLEIIKEEELQEQVLENNWIFDKASSFEIQKYYEMNQDLMVFLQEIIYLIK